MKLKKGLIALIISIMILSISTNVFAVTRNSNSEKTLKDALSQNKVENKIENKVANRTENKVENKVKNETKDDVKNKTKNEVSKNYTEKETTKDSKTNIINEDIAKASEDDLEYKNLKINGNMFLSSVKNVKFDNMEVNGDVVILSDSIEINDSKISGSIYSASDKISISNSKIVSSYLVSSNVKVDRDTIVSREFKVIGENVVLNGEIGRRVYVFCENIEIGEDAIIGGNAEILSETKKISEDANIRELDYEKVSFSNESDTDETVITYLIEKGTEVLIIVLISIFLLCLFPKFTQVNSSLKIRDFVKSFFTGLLEFLIILAIGIALIATGYGIGYGLLLINLLFSFVILGKIIFVISLAIRISCKPEKVSKLKVFFTTVFVALVLAIIEMISLLGTVGFIIDVIINIILAFTGLGSMFRVIFTSQKKLKVSDVIEEKEIKETTDEPREEKVEIIENVGQVEIQSEIQEEVKEEIKKELEELKKDKEEEKKIEENNKKEENNETEKEDENKENE